MLYLESNAGIWHTAGSRPGLCSGTGWLDRTKLLMKCHANSFRIFSPSIMPSDSRSVPSLPLALHAPAVADDPTFSHSITRSSPAASPIPPPS
eukprot:scaffold19247_cov135-Isochrysis_galbana.AAC.3